MLAATRAQEIELMTEDVVLHRRVGATVQDQHGNFENTSPKFVKTKGYRTFIKGTEQTSEGRSTARHYELLVLPWNVDLREVDKVQVGTQMWEVDSVGDNSSDAISRAITIYQTR